MKIIEAKWQDGWLMLKTHDVDARNFAYAFSQKNEAGDYELKKKPSLRSLTANAYAWVLIDKLSEAVGEKKTDVYRRAVKDVGGNMQTVCLQNKSVEMFRRIWEKNGIGWQTEQLESRIAGCTNVQIYYGSSTFDTKQMSRLIDNLVQDCKALGIETMPPEQLERLLSGWGEK